MPISSQNLKIYASHPSHSKGRLLKEEEDPRRSFFQRDRERIIHAKAFRRLMHKTQVFISVQGDHYRTRLTHTIEVAQIARALARALGLNEDLAEAIALAHDVGHAPFGHVGEDALNLVTEQYGGFDHNAQALRIVTKLENRYIRFKGLNLSWETLEGLVKHNGPLLGPHARPLEVDPSILEFNEKFDLHLDQFAGLEAQCAAIADDIAYNAHDIDDVLRAGLLDIEKLKEVPLLHKIIAEIEETFPSLSKPQYGYELVRRQIACMIEDVISETEKRLAQLAPQSVKDIYQAQQTMVSFSASMEQQEKQLKKFLYKNFYFHPSLLERREQAEKIVTELFKRYQADIHCLPLAWQKKALGLSESDYVQLICDFLSGMTDNYAVEEYKRLFKT